MLPARRSGVTDYILFLGKAPPLLGAFPFCSGDIMVFLRYVFVTLVFLGVAFTSRPSSAILVGNQSVQSNKLGGVWTGSFLQKEWTFEFTAEGSDWSGRYMPPGGVKWHPLSGLVVSGRSVSFSMDTKPKLSFALEIDAVKPTLSGPVTIDGVATVLFSATRKP